MTSSTTKLSDRRSRTRRRKREHEDHSDEDRHALAASAPVELKPRQSSEHLSLETLPEGDAQFLPLTAPASTSPHHPPRREEEREGYSERGGVINEQLISTKLITRSWM